MYKDILNKNDFHFQKKFGQNFLTDTNLLAAIVSDAGVEETDTVIEVGMGAGALTKELAKKANRVVGFEIDPRLEPILAETLSDVQNAELYFKDVLKVPKEELLLMVGGEFKVVANLPYYITTPIIFYFLELSQCRSLTIMVQKEVAERLTSKAGTGSYGAVTAQVAAYGKATVTRAVGRKMFTPEPNVDSAVVRIDKIINPQITNPKLLQRVIAAAFDMRRKTLVNNLTKNFPLKKEQAENILTSLGLSPTIRGEMLDLSLFIKLADKIDEALN